MLGSFCYIEMGTSIRMSGGDFAYLCFMKWYPLAFAFMSIGCIINYPATLAIQAETFAEYIMKGFDVEMDPTSTFWTRKFLGFAIIFLLLFMNFFSLKTFVQKFSIAASISKILTTLLIIGTGFYFLIFKNGTSHFAEPFANSNWNPGVIVTALFAGLYSYDGWDILNFGLEEIDQPRRTMPMALIFGMSGIAIIYVAMNVSYFAVLDAGTFNSSQAVAIDFANTALHQARWVMPLLVGILMVGTLNSTMFSASRYLQAVARARMIPSFISCLNPICDSPRSALFVHVCIAIAISFIGDLDNLINYVAFAQWSQRAFTMAALVWIRFRHWEVHPEKIRMPIVMPIFFCFVCTSLIVINTIDDFSSAAVGIGIILGGFIFFMLFVFEKAFPRFQWYRNLTERMNESTTKFIQIVFNVMPEFSGMEDRDIAIGKKRAIDTDGEITSRKGSQKIFPEDETLKMRSMSQKTNNSEVGIRNSKTRL
ncbi:hypothetical protein WR25_12224 isoform D [Diploscapter pachys]|nr:hypothetical protein WR25_12224 isoform D [Diploscapter pachys]